MASIIAAAIVSAGGKVLVSRQYQEISRIQIEGLLSAFPKLLGTGSTSKEYTVVESGSYRYVFQPAEALYLVVLSTTQSNIVEDLAALRMLGRMLPDRCPSMDEASVGRHAFDILFAFDEVVTNGQREIVSLEQVSTILEMFSSEEELENQRKKELEGLANKIANEKAHELRKMKSQLSHSHDYGGGSGGGGGSVSMMGEAGAGGGAPIKGGFSDVAADLGKGGGGGGGSSRFGSGGGAGGGGLSLSSKNRRTDALSKALKESGGSGAAAAAAASSGAESQGAAAAASASAAHSMPVTIRVEEKISAALNREGGVASLDISGTLSVTVEDASASNVRVVLGPMAPVFTTKSHPIMNKDLFSSDSILATKDNKPYVIGAATQVLRWRAQNPGSAIKVPLAVNCWPSATGASIEFEHENSLVPLSNVRIALPLAGVKPKVTDCSCGEHQYDAQNGVLIWYIPEINRNNNSGTLSVEIGTAVQDSHFFPAQVAFDAPVSLANVAIVAVQNVDTGARVQYSCDTILSADEYVVN
jgi:hypothetical protein